MSAIATAEPIARKNAVGHFDVTDNKANTGVLCKHYAQPEELTQEEWDRLRAESEDYEDFTGKAIAFGKLTGDFAIDRHILPQHTGAEIDAAILRIQAEHLERFTGKSVMWAGD